MRGALYGALGLVGAVLLYLVKLVLEKEYPSWAHRLSDLLVRGAVRISPPREQDRWRREWSAELNADRAAHGTGGLTFAVSLIPGAVRLALRDMLSDVRPPLRKDALRPIVGPVAGVILASTIPSLDLKVGWVLTETATAVAIAMVVFGYLRRGTGRPHPMIVGGVAASVTGVICDLGFPATVALTCLATFAGVLAYRALKAAGRIAGDPGVRFVMLGLTSFAYLDDLSTATAALFLFFLVPVNVLPAAGVVLASRISNRRWAVRVGALAASMLFVAPYLVFGSATEVAACLTFAALHAGFAPLLSEGLASGSFTGRLMKPAQANC